MNSHWQDFLHQQTLCFPATLDQNLCMDLSAWSVLAIRGADAETFLQGQSTHDVRLVSADNHCPGAWCNHKGRILANFRMCKREDTYYALLPAELMADNLQRLQKYVLRAHVELRDVSDELTRMGICGPAAAESLATLLDTALPTAANSSLTHAGVTVLRMGTEDRFILLGDAATLMDIWRALQAQGFVAADAWLLYEILAGFPWITPPTCEAFVPQMVNYELLGGVGFDKGCYTGQEVVARTQYLGTIKRRLYVAYTDNNHCEPIDYPLFSGKSVVAAESDEEVGKVVNGVAHPAGGGVWLVVLKTAYADKPLRLCTGTALKVGKAGAF